MFAEVTNVTKVHVKAFLSLLISKISCVYSINWLSANICSVLSYQPRWSDAGLCVLARE